MELIMLMVLLVDGLHQPFFGCCGFVGCEQNVVTPPGIGL